MKFVIVLVVLFAVAIARPDGNAQILRAESDNIGVGPYNYVYETSNGIAAQESGQLKNAGTDDEAMSVQGSFSWVAPDGQQYTITYVADENGFRPQGAHIPQ